MKIIHNGATYECDVAVKCECDNFIKLYDANGAEIASFHNISDFSEYTISGGSFVAPGECAMPIPLTTYSIGRRTITTNDWILSDDETHFYYEIASDLISDNITTCNVTLLFARNTELDYEATQEAGKVILSVEAAPLDDVVIEGIYVTRV